MAIELKILNGDNEFVIDVNKVIRFHFIEDGNMVQAGDMRAEVLLEFFNKVNEELRTAPKLPIRWAEENKDGKD